MDAEGACGWLLAALWDSTLAVIGGILVEEKIIWSYPSGRGWLVKNGMGRAKYLIPVQDLMRGCFGAKLCL